jgi:phage terminase small subunit
MALNFRQQDFCRRFASCFNVTEAAKGSGYSEKSAYSIGSENLKKPEIAAEIKRLIAENVMGDDEVRTRLADIARGDIADLMAIGSTGFNFDLIQADDSGNKVINPKTKLIKKIKQKVTTHIGKKEDSDDTEIIETELELYSALDALEFIARMNGMVTEKKDITSGGKKILVTLAGEELDDE